MLRAHLLAGLLLGGAGCAETFVPSKLNVSTIQLSALQSTVTRDGVGVGAQLLGFSEFQQGKAPSIEVRWRVLDIAAAQALGRGEDGPTKQMQARIPLVPVPALYLAIDNQSAAPIDFEKAQITLESASGKKYAALLNPVEVADRVELYLRENYPRAAQSEELTEGLRNRVVAMPLVHKKLQIPPKQRFDGILVLEVAAFSLKDAEAAFTGEKFTLTLSALGGDATPFTIAIPFIHGEAQINVSCPQGKTASATICKLPPL